jgi:hypothetical protein
VPETAVNKDDFLAACKDEIGFSRYEPTVQSVAVTKPMSQLPDRNLRPGVFRADERHPLAAFTPRKGIRHVPEMLQAFRF